MIRPQQPQPRPEAFSIAWAQEHGLIPREPPPTREELAEALLRVLVTSYGGVDRDEAYAEGWALLARMK